MSSEPDRRGELTSWKAIADYLGVNVRTAQKWEARRGLPVHRMAGEKGRVWVLPSELDKWRSLASARPQWWSSLAFSRYCATVSTLLLVAAVALLVRDRLAVSRPGPPALFRIEHRTLFVTDASHRPLWQRTFERPLVPEAYDGRDRQQRVWFDDLDGDSRRETLFVCYPINYATAGTSLQCFDQDGHPKWSFHPPAVTDAQQTYSRDYIISDLAVVDFEDRRGRSIAVTSRHIVYHPNHFTILDGHGAPLGQYWHSGHLDYMAFADLDGDGVKEAILSGVNNGHQAATLVVLDPRSFSGCSDQGRASPFQIQGVPLAREKAVLLFPRSCISRKFGPYNMGKDIRVRNGLIEVDVLERLDELGERHRIIYTLNYDLSPARVEPADDFVNAHRRLELTGELNHRLTAREMDSWRNIKVLKPAAPVPASLAAR